MQHFKAQIATDNDNDPWLCDFMIVENSWKCVIIQNKKVVAEFANTKIIDCIKGCSDFITAKGNLLDFIFCGNEDYANILERCIRIERFYILHPKMRKKTSEIAEKT